MHTEQVTGQSPHVLAGLIQRPELRTQLNRCDRTIIRWERNGMPFIAMGAMRLYDPQKVREWLLTHERGRHTPKRGRPRSAA